MEITIKKEAVEYALNTLNSQCAHIKRYKHNTHAQKRQMAYYQGMHAMLNAIVQQGYTDDSLLLWINSDCTHSIVKKEDIS